MGGLGNTSHVDHLTGVILNAGQQHDCQRFTLLANQVTQRTATERRLPGFRFRNHQRLGRVKTMVQNLRLSHLIVRRKRMFLNQDFMPRFRGAIKRGQHQMQVHRQAIHHDDFVRFCSDQVGHRLGQTFVIRHPRVFRFEMSSHAQTLPLFQFCLHEPRCSFRLQAQRIANEINFLIAIFTGRNPELVTPLS